MSNTIYQGCSHAGHKECVHIWVDGKLKCSKKLKENK